MSTRRRSTARRKGRDSGPKRGSSRSGTGTPCRSQTNLPPDFEVRGFADLTGRGCRGSLSRDARAADIQHGTRIPPGGTRISEPLSRNRVPSVAGATASSRAEWQSRKSHALNATPADEAEVAIARQSARRAKPEPSSSRVWETDCTRDDFRYCRVTNDAPGRRMRRPERRRSANHFGEAPVPSKSVCENRIPVSQSARCAAAVRCFPSLPRPQRCS